MAALLTCRAQLLTGPAARRFASPSTTWWSSSTPISTACPTPRSPVCGVDDVDRADFILVGHSHFDHLWGAERIAPRTGATVIGSYETIRLMAEHGVPESQLQPVSAGERIRLSDDVVVSVYPSLHSCVWTGPFQQPDVECLGDVGLTLDQQKLRFRDLEAHIATLSPEARAHALRGRQVDRGDGGALVYLIETPRGRCSTRTRRVTGRGSCATFAPTSRSWPRRGGAISTVTRFRARSPSSWPGKPRSSNRTACCSSHHDNWLPGFSLETNTAPIRDASGRAGARHRAGRDRLYGGLSPLQIERVAARAGGSEGYLKRLRDPWGDYAIRPRHT